MTVAEGDVEGIISRQAQFHQLHGFKNRPGNDPERVLWLASPFQALGAGALLSQIVCRINAFVLIFPGYPHFMIARSFNLFNFVHKPLSD